MPHKQKITTVMIIEAINASISYDCQLNSQLLTTQLQHSDQSQSFEARVYLRNKLLCFLDNVMIIQAIRSWLMVEYDLNPYIKLELFTEEAHHISASF